MHITQPVRLMSIFAEGTPSVWVWCDVRHGSFALMVR